MIRYSAWALAAVAVAAVAACGSASTTPTASPATQLPTTATTSSAANGTDAYPIVASLQGHLTGPWTNSTFGSKGTMSWDIVADASTRTVTIAITLTGNVLGGTAPAPERIELTHLAQGQVQGNSVAFGTVSGTIGADGRIHMTLSHLPNSSISSVDATGTINRGTTLALAYTVSFSNGSTAKGTANLTKQ